MEYLVFRRSGLLLGVAIEFIRQVVGDLKIAPVPLTPPGYAGMLYYRGELFDVADLGLILQKKPAVKAKEIPKGTRIILIKWNAKGIALAADEITGLTSVKEDSSEAGGFLLDGMPVTIITPERVWQLLSDLPYGPR